MYIISNNKQQYFVGTDPVTHEELWTSSRGCANWFITAKAAKELIDIKARQRVWDAQSFSVLPATSNFAQAEL